MKTTVNVSLKQIEDFLTNDAFVLFGVSRDKKKFGNTILKELTGKGLKIYPIHREMEMLEDIKCYKKLSSLPEKIDAAIICTQAEKTIAILEDLKSNGIKNVWLQRGSADMDIYRNFTGDFSNLIFNKCILMFANQSGIHKFHSRILRFFGKYPR